MHWKQLHIQCIITRQYASTDAQQRMHGVCLTCYLHCSELHYSAVGVICEQDNQICFSPAQQ